MNAARKAAIIARVIAVKAIAPQLYEPSLSDDDADELYEALEAALLEVARIAHPEGT